MYNFNMTSNPLWGNKSHLGQKPISSNFFNKEYETIKYYSGIDAEIYFEGLYIDEIVEINFAMQQNTLPLFGYNSYVYDELAVGSRIVNGQFTINFTQGEYMYKIIKELSSMHANNKKNNSKDVVKDRGRKAVLNQTFNIILNYGKSSHNGFADNEGVTQIYLTGVQLTGCTQQFSVAGDPIYETYSFIAKDMVPGFAISEKEEKSLKEETTSFVPDEKDAYKLLIKTAEYYEEQIEPQGLDSLHCIGKMKIELETDLDVKTISVNPKINTSESQAAKNIEVTNEKSIVFAVTKEQQSDIRKYYKDNGSSMPADFFAQYIENGELRMIEPRTIDIKLKNILNE